MNQVQKKYALKRVDEILNSKLRVLKSKMPKIEYKVVTLKKAVALIKSGAVKLKKSLPNKSLGSSNLSDVYDLSDYYRPKSYSDPVYDQKEYDKRKKPLLDKAQSVKDTLMLGDSIEALAMLKELEAM